MSVAGRFVAGALPHGGVPCEPRRGSLAARHVLAFAIAFLLLPAGALAPLPAGVAGRAWAAKPAPKPAPKKESPPPVLEETPGENVDLAYGAYQRGYYLTAFNEAMKRVRAGTDPAALTLLGELYSKGFGVPYDPARAREWYQKAADAGSTDAVFALGLMALTGAGQKADEAVAARYFREAAEKGNGAAAYNLGLLYMQGNIVPQDFTQAAHWFEIAADQDLEDAIYALAVLTKEGNGVERDLPKAAKLMAKAAALNHVTAQVEFAIMEFNGIGVPKDEAAAAALFRKAALAGNAIAQNRYARLLATGRGVPEDKEAAAAWHLLAKKRGLGDPMLDGVVASLPEKERKVAEGRALMWSNARP